MLAFRVCSAITIWLCDQATSTGPGDVHLSFGHNAIMTVRCAVADALPRLRKILKGMRNVSLESDIFHYLSVMNKRLSLDIVSNVF